MCFSLLQRMKFCFIASYIRYSCFPLESVDSTLDIIVSNSMAPTTNIFYSIHLSKFHFFAWCERMHSPCWKWMNEDIGYTIMKGITHQKWNAYELFADIQILLSHMLWGFSFGKFACRQSQQSQYILHFCAENTFWDGFHKRWNKLLTIKTIESAWTTMANQFVVGWRHAHTKLLYATMKCVQVLWLLTIEAIFCLGDTVNGNILLGQFLNFDSRPHSNPFCICVGN